MRSAGASGLMFGFGSGGPPGRGPPPVMGGPPVTGGVPVVGTGPTGPPPGLNVVLGPPPGPAPDGE
jgi:hypothetical protein